MDFFISDCHFGHQNIIKHCNRPFESVSDMHTKMIESWNSVVTSHDRVFVVGDVFLCDEEEASKIMSKLSGYKILIAGNHDRSERTMLRAGFDEYHREYSYSLGDIGQALLKHYPLPDRVIKEKGYDCLIHGHLHHPPHSDGLKVNVAADLINFTPVGVNYIRRILSRCESNEDNEMLDLEFNDEILKLNLEIRVEDFSGSVDHIYSILRKYWLEGKK